MFAKNYNTDWEEQQRVLRVKLQIEPRNLHSQQRLTRVFSRTNFPPFSIPRLFSHSSSLRTVGKEEARIYRRRWGGERESPKIVKKNIYNI